MFVQMSLRPSPLTMVAALLVIGGVYGMRRDEGQATVPGCDPETQDCSASTNSGSTFTEVPIVQAEDFCVDVGYLCADLAERDEVQLRRWVGHEGTVVVHIPLPDVSNSATARDLQRAAAQGIRAWNNQPFPILADLRGDRSPHFSVRWTQLGGRQLGVARTQWSQRTGLEVVDIQLGTSNPIDFGPADPRQVRLTAAHEMGHALGLGHSDASRDVMYPTNTATSMSAQDYRSIEVLYQTQDGTIIRR